MTLQDQLDAIASFNDCMERMKRATYTGTTKELRDAVNDCDYVRGVITDGTGLTPTELEQQLRVLRG